VEVIILQEKALTCVPCGECEPNVIAAVDFDAGGIEAVAKGFDMDTSRLGRRCQDPGKPCGENRKGGRY